MKPWLTQEFDVLVQQLYHSQAHVITLAGASAGCGTSTLCRWLAERFSDEHARVLLVDLDIRRDRDTQMGSNWQLDNENITRHLISLSPTLSLLPAPSSPHTQLALKQPQKLQSAITHWRDQFDYIFCDVGNVNSTNWRSLPAASVAAVSDGTVLCVAAGKTHEAELLHSVKRLTQGNASLLGTLINDRDYPTLASDISRSLNQHTRWLPAQVRRWLISKINQSALLQGEYQR
ncbi:cellulose synthase operon protein YhjQ/BcsQ [Thaumasiovibrio sp. DFM-14]|uniref:cellulose synthase operon protein YhjQ/BcsQ n=1 Tax=Thaumasiovibrio sp. DFM-14 TaxID=3384792 RepID=UPI0039A002B5